MSSKVKVTMNARGRRELLRSSEVEGHLRSRMGAALAVAQATAPVDSGAYVASLALDDTAAPSRARVRLVARAPHAHLVEAHHGTLSRALDAAGGADKK